MRRVALVSVVFVIVLLGAGCLGIGGGPDRSERAETTLEAVNDSLQTVSTYRAETELHATAVVDGEEHSRTATIDGAFNRTQRRAKTTLSMDGETRRVYIDNRTVYQECESPWGWTNSSMDGRQWIRETTLGRHVGLLESGELRLETTTALAGEEAVMLVGRPSNEALQAYRETSAQPVIGGTNIENVTVRLVVDNQTHRPLRGTVTFEAAGNGATATVTMRTTFSSYGAPVHVSIPEPVTEGEFDWEGGCPGA